ncbi:hypothetical protein [Lactococcus lactis]
MTKKIRNIVQYFAQAWSAWAFLRYFKMVSCQYCLSALPQSQLLSYK